MFGGKSDWKLAARLVVLCWVTQCASVLIHEHNDEYLVDLCKENITEVYIRQSDKNYDHGFLQVIDPDLNDSYPMDFHCRVHLVPHLDQVTTLWLLWLDTHRDMNDDQCTTDYMELYGARRNWYRLHFCGDRFPIHVLKSDVVGETITIEFHSGEESFNHSGFAVRYAWDKFNFLAVHLSDVALISGIFIALVLGMVLVPLIILKVAQKATGRDQLVGDFPLELSPSPAAAGGGPTIELPTLADNPSTPDLPPPYPLEPAIQLPGYDSTTNMPSPLAGPPPYNYNYDQDDDDDCSDDDASYT